jgi:hypothetical protein
MQTIILQWICQNSYGRKRKKEEPLFPRRPYPRSRPESADGRQQVKEREPNPGQVKPSLRLDAEGSIEMIEHLDEFDCTVSC